MVHTTHHNKENGKALYNSPLGPKGIPDLLESFAMSMHTKMYNNQKKKIMRIRVSCLLFILYTHWFFVFVFVSVLYYFIVHGFSLPQLKLKKKKEGEEASNIKTCTLAGNKLYMNDW